jgi:hypothetical protein
LIEEARKAGKLAKGAMGNPKGRGAKIVRVEEKPAHPTLAMQGIDKNLADRARKAAAMSESPSPSRAAPGLKGNPQSTLPRHARLAIAA